MPTDITLISALLVGFFGGVHCVGMCGGIVGALALGLPEPLRARATATWPFLIAYNLGRIGSYTLAGALVGGLGAALAELAFLNQAQRVLQVIAALFMLALGLYLGGWWHGLVRIERLGAVVWRRIEPLGRRFLPVRTPWQALLVGVLWGWLPCGLVYSVLIWALVVGSAERGALLLLSFGLGTLPTLLLMGVLAAQLSAFVRRPWPRRVAGGLVLAFAGVMFLRAF